MLNRMVDERETFKVREGLVEILRTPHAREALVAFPERIAFSWPHGRRVQSKVEAIATRRQAESGPASPAPTGPGRGASRCVTPLSLPFVAAEGLFDTGAGKRFLAWHEAISNDHTQGMASHAAMATWMLGEQALMGIEAYQRGTFTWSDVGVSSAHAGVGLGLFVGLDHLYTALLFGAPKSTWLARQAMLNMGRVPTSKSMLVGIVGAGLAAATIGAVGSYWQGERRSSKLLYAGATGFVSGGVGYVLGSAAGSWLAQGILRNVSPALAGGAIGTFMSGLSGVAAGSTVAKATLGLFSLQPGAETPDRGGYHRPIA